MLEPAPVLYTLPNFRHVITTAALNSNRKPLEFLKVVFLYQPATHKTTHLSTSLMNLRKIEANDH